MNSVKQEYRAAKPTRPRLGLPFLLLLAYPVLDYARPENPMGIPMVLSALLFLAWILAPRKRINADVVCFILLLGAMGIGVVTATNTYSAYLATYAMTLILLCTCMPIVQFVDSIRKTTIFVNTLVLVFVYVAIFIISSGGHGPGWQDENYAAGMMCMAIPLAYFSIPLAERTFTRIFYAAAAGTFVIAVIATESRGGFVGLLGVVLFCLFYSPKKRLAVAALIIGGVLAAAVAGPKYWEEMGTITDTKESTADMRLELWAIAWRMFLHNPVLGVGPGNYRWRIGDYQSAEQLEKFGRVLTESILVHSTYFEMLSELGLVGVTLFGIILVRIFHGLVRVGRLAESHIRKIDSQRRHDLADNPLTGVSDLRKLRYLALAILGALSGYLLTAAFVSFTYYAHFWLLAALAVALREVGAKAFDRL